MATDDRTAELNLPKVHADNNPRLEDVPRLRQFADLVDAALAARPDSAAVSVALASAISGLATQAALDAIAAARVPTSRTVGAGTGLQGGGALSGDVALSLDAATTTSLDRADTAVQPTRQVFAGTGMTGGGNLGGNVTLALNTTTITSLGKADTALQPADRPYATDGDAEAGTSLTVVMNADKTRHMLDYRPPGVKLRWVTSSGGVTPLATDQGGYIVLGAGYSGNVTLPEGLPAGFAVTVVNDLSGDVDVVLGGSATLRVLIDGTTGPFTLAGAGFFTAVNTGSNYWHIFAGGHS